MTDISNPNKVEVRGYVMLMLQRSAGMVGKSTEECTAIQQLMCLLEENCTSACEEAMKDVNKDEEKEDEKKDDEKKSGKLTVNVDSESSVRSIPSKGSIVVDSIDFSVDEEITINGITIESVGLSKNKDVKRVRLEQNGKRIGSTSTISSDGIADININGDGFVVKKSDSLDLVMELSGTDAGAEIAFNINDVKSTAKDLKIKNSRTTTCRTTTYEVVSVNFEAMSTNSGTIYKLGEKDSVELGRFKLHNESDSKDEKTVSVKTITLKNIGTADLSALTDVKVMKNSEVVSKDVTIDGNKNLVIVLNDEIAAGKTNTYTLQGKVTAVNGTDGSEYYKFSLNKETDLIVDEKKTNFRCDVKKEGEFAVFALKGGKFTFKTSTDGASVDAGDGYSDIVLATGTLIATTSASIEEKDNASLTIEGTNFDLLKNFKLSLGNSTYTFTINDAGTAATIDGDIDIKKGTNEFVLMANMKSNLKDTDEGKTIKVNNITANSFSEQGEYESSEQFNPTNEINGSISISNINVKGARFTITKTSTDSNIKMVATSSKTVSIYAGTMKNTQQFPININTVTLTGTEVVTGFETAKENFSLDFIVNGKVLDTVRFDKNSTTVNFNSLGINLPVDSSVDFEIQATPTTISGDIVYEFTIAAEGNDENGNTVTTSPKTAVKVTIVNKGTVEANNSTDKVKATTWFTKGTTKNAIAEFEVTIKDEDLTLKEVSFDDLGDTSDIISDIELAYKSEGKEYSINGDYDADTHKIDNMSTKFVPGTYTILAYANFNDVTGDIRLNKISYKFEWVELIEDTQTITAYVHKVKPVIPVVSIVSTNGELDNLMTIRISNTSSDESFTLTSLDATNSALGLKAQIGNDVMDLSDLNGKKVNSKSYVDIILISEEEKIEAGAYNIKINALDTSIWTLDNSNSDLGTNKFQKSVTVKTN